MAGSQYGGVILNGFSGEGSRAHPGTVQCLHGNCQLL